MPTVTTVGVVIELFVRPKRLRRDLAGEEPDRVVEHISSRVDISTPQSTTTSLASFASAALHSPLQSFPALLKYLAHFLFWLAASGATAIIFEVLHFSHALAAKFACSMFGHIEKKQVWARQLSEVVAKPLTLTLFL